MDKKIGLFCTHGGIKGKTLEKLEARLAGNTVLSKIDFREPLKYNKDESIKKAKQWCIKLIREGM